ncbi:MAG: poly(3-hydroxybutyrate) depolymerase [Burkholderiaceae bacterium]|jgi:poly(3-hydroxybutyrate) depolymerase
MTTPAQLIHTPIHEHTVPLFWPMAAGIELGTSAMKLFQHNLRYISETEKIVAPNCPEWATSNRIMLELETMRLRDFSATDRPFTHTPVLIDAPYAGHSSTIADYKAGQSLVETLQASGLEHVLVTDWKSATPTMKNFDIDKYLAEINVVVDDLGGLVDLIGLCQGGWMSAMYAARFPHKVRTLVLAGAPIDTDAGNGPIKKLAHTLPMALYEEMVSAGGGLMRGKTMLAGWKSMNPQEQYMGKFLELYQHIEDKNYIKRTEKFERWYENPIDLPGAYYLQTIKQIFKENRLAKGEFVGLGKRLSLKDIVCPVYLLAGSEDDITTIEQVFDAEKYLGTPPEHIVKKIASGGHIGLFMGAKTLAECWPEIARWVRSGGKSAG